MDKSLHARLAELIASTGDRSPADGDRLVAALHGWCWPGGVSDRTEPVSRAWVRRWGPHCLGAIVAECTCAAGRCHLCN
jgi:hypothetical protein